MALGSSLLSRRGTRVPTEPPRIVPFTTDRPLRLTEHDADEVSPVWSPDGRQIAFVRMLEVGAAITGAIYTLPSLGGQEGKLTDLEGYLLLGLSWSPAGQWLAFVEKTAEGEPARIVRLSLDTLEKQPLTSPPKGTLGDVSPELSPDGRLLAFVRSGAGEKGLLAIDPAPGEAGQNQLDESNVAPVTSRPRGEKSIHLAHVEHAAR